jgi:hypothetical protein
MAYVAQLLGYDSSVQSAAFEYLNAPSNVYANPDFNTNTATTISYTSYTDSTLTVNSPAGYYSNGVISRYYDNVNKTLSVATLCEYTSFVSGCCSQGIFELSPNSTILVGSILNLNSTNFCYIAVPTPSPQTYYTSLNVYGGFTTLSPNTDCNDISCQPCPLDCLGICDVLIIDADKVWGYNYASNISTNLTLNFNPPPPTTTSIPNIISTTDKIWLADSNDLYEYDFTGCTITGFYAVFNRIITFSYPIGQSITAAIDDVTLLGTFAGDIVQIDISGVSPVLTTQSQFLMLGRYVTDMIYTNSAPNKLICLYRDTFGASYVTQYDYITGAIEYDITLSNLGNNPIGIFTTSGNLYILDIAGAVYNLQLYFPYNVTYVKNTTFIKPRSSSQSDICNNVVINPPTPPPPPPPPPIPIPGVTVNNCTPITILPLGIECVTLTAATQNYLFGSLSVNVTGGTSPYGVVWKSPNGVTSNGYSINNVPVGNYVVTVVDFWGDSSATTTCSLSAISNCSFSGSVVLYTPPLPSPSLSYYNVQITGGTSPGGYSIYYDIIGNSNYADILPTLLPASGITLTQLDNNIGIDIQVPVSFTKIILYNESCGTYEEFS